MGRYDYEFTHQFASLEKQIAKTENPLHRKILKNYRMHGLLEISGRYKELLAPDMTVEHPHYRIHEGGKSIILDGMDEVAAFYQSLIDARATVMWVREQNMAVYDFGFAGEADFWQFVPSTAIGGESVFDSVKAGDDSNDIYLVKRTLAFVWHYDDQGRLIGENVYEDHASKEIIKPDPVDIITPERAIELLAPEIAKELP